VANRGRRPAEQTIVRTKLAAWRVRRGLTQEELAELARISRSKLIRLERNLAFTDMRVQDLAQLATALGCEPSDLLEHDWMRWRHPKLEEREVSGHWRDGERPAAPPTRAEAQRELRGLLKTLPDKIVLRGGRRTSTSTATAPQLGGAAHELELAAILEHDEKTSAQHAKLATRLRRAAELRELAG
jgi:transcriptional regulator with XRE-family HTH domain